MAYGYTGRLLNVDLTARSFSVTEIDQDDIQRFIGGAGYNAWLLYNAALKNKNIDPLGPENPLIFGAGPLVGASFPTASRCSFTALSPLTKIFGESNGGGVANVAIKRSGFDHIKITGASETPCMLIVGCEGDCRIEDASDLWGLDTRETENRINRKYPKATPLTIGPAGENMVKYASISSFSNGAIFGRTGMGAVMGSKRLKAIVALGRREVAVKAPRTLNDITKKILRDCRNNSRPRLFHRHGAAMLLNMVVAKGLMYGENWRRRILPQDVTSIDIGSYCEAADSKSFGCFRCPLTCKRKWTIKAGPYESEEGHGYEIAHILSFGLTLGIRDVSTILHLINRCNHAGFDLIEFSGAVGMAIDAFRHGHLGKDMADGLRLDWNNGQAVDALIDKVTNREGIGDVLAEGTREAARSIGPAAEKYALHMKGMHWPAHSAPPFALAFSLAPRGGNLKGLPHLLLQENNAEITRKLFGATDMARDIYTHQDKGRAVWWHENYKAIIDSMGSCFWLSAALLPHGGLLPDELARVYNAVTGVGANGLDIMQAAERVLQVERAINALRGMARKDDSFTKRPEPDSWGHGIDLEAKGMLDEYYAYRGLSGDGLATRPRLEEIGLESVADGLENWRLLGTAVTHLPVSTIVTDPTQADLGRGLWSKIIAWMEKKMMKKLEDPNAYRRFFEKQGERIRKKHFRDVSDPGGGAPDKA